MEMSLCFMQPKNLTKIGCQQNRKTYTHISHDLNCIFVKSNYRFDGILYILKYILFIEV